VVHVTLVFPTIALGERRRSGSARATLAAEAAAGA
jgi:hypothetical protein